MASDVPAPIAVPATVPSTVPSTVPATVPDANVVNPFGRRVTIAVELRQNNTLLGTIPLTIATDGQLFVPLNALTALVDKQLSATELARLQAATDAQGLVPVATINRGNLQLAYDPRRVEMVLTHQFGDDPTTQLSLGFNDSPPVINLAAPAKTSFYATFQTSLDYISKGGTPGLAAPVIDGQFALRAADIVVEDEHLLDPNRNMGKVTRLGTRAIYDIPQWDTRLTLGDTDTLTAGFQQGSSLLGFSASRLYRTFEPSRNIRPTSLDSFTLNQASDVEILVNGNVVRRMALAPGRYTLNDFPFVSGSNQVQIQAVDQTGTREIANFKQYFDLNLLHPGLSEFSFNAGMLSTPGLGGPSYNWSRPYMSGFYRQGVTKDLTLGINTQADGQSQQVGSEVTYASSLATLGINTALSRFNGHGLGGAFRIDAQRINDAAAPGQFNAINVGAEVHSANFSTPGTFMYVGDTLRYRLSSDASVRLSGGQSLNFGASYTSSRHQPATYDLRSNYSFRLGYGATLSLGANYNVTTAGRSGFGALINLSMRLGAHGFASISADSLERSGLVSYSEASSQAVGSHSTHLVGSLQEGVSSLSGDVNFITNRADLDIAHTLDYDIGGTSLTGSRTSLRAGASIAFADGEVAIGRPIRDSFAIIERNATLADNKVVVDSTPTGPKAQSDGLGAPMVSDITEYSQRTLRVDVPDAPNGYDLGANSFPLRPPYKAGYKLAVGSEYTASALGTLRDRMGKPVPLAVGSVVSLDDPTAPHKEVFTNSMGRISISGLKGGHWAIILPGDIEMRYLLVVPNGTKGLFKFGTLDPQQ